MIQTVTDRRRIMIVAIICVLVINIVMPVRRAEAVVPVVVAGAAVGTFVGVVAIGAIAMDVFGMQEQSEKTMAFAQATWSVSSQWAKDQVMTAYNKAVAAGDKVMTLSADVADYFAGKYENFLSSEEAAKGQDWASYDAVQGTWHGIAASTSSAYQGRSYSIYPPRGYKFSSFLGFADRMYLYLYYYGPSIDKDYYEARMGNTTVGTFVWSMPSYTSDEIAPHGDFALISRLVYGLVGSPSLVPTSYAPGANLPRVRDAFPLSLPVPTPGDFVYQPVSNPGVDVYQKGDQLVDDAGKIYNPDQVQVKVAPQTQVATDAAGNPIKDAAGNPVLGVPVGAVAGNPAIPGTIVNVKTGEAVKTGDTVANPPLDWASQPTTSINWAPLKMTGAALTRVFPFSIPWDVAAQLQIFNVKPEIPVIHVDIPRFWVAGDFVWHLKFDIDFTMFDPVAIGIRWFGNIAFTIGLALAMRRFMPQ